MPVPVRGVLAEAGRADEGLSGTELDAVRRWRKQVSHVAAQEMLHLALVHNLLSAIGAAPHMARPNLPAPASHYPAGVQLALLPFGEQALRHFMFLERPEGMDLADADGPGRDRPGGADAERAGHRPRGQDFATVGHLYRSIEAGFAHLADDARRGLAVRRAAPRTGDRGAFRLAGAGRRDRPGQRAARDRGDPGAGRGPARSLAGRAFRAVRGDPGRVPAAARGQPGLRPGPPGDGGQRPARPSATSRCR